MITEKKIKEGGYAVLPKGGWIRIDPTIIPHDWEDICKDFGADSGCTELILCVAGVKEVWEK